MLTTSGIRREWAPACPPASVRTAVSFHGEGRANVLTALVPAFQALNACLVAHDYRTRRADTGGFNCRPITGGTGYSPHAYGVAVDINWQSNPYGPRLVTDMPTPMVNAIKAIRTNSGAQVFRWGGDYRTNKDAMHFEIVCTRADIATGIRGGTTPTPTPPPKPGGFLMALTDAQQDELLAKTRANNMLLTELQAHVVGTHDAEGSRMDRLVKRIDRLVRKTGA